jgi:hypothetical protein
MRISANKKKTKKAAKRKKFRKKSLEKAIKMASRKIVLGTWGIRLNGEHVRLALELSGITDYEQKRYSTPEEWAKDAPTVGLTNLPYLQVGDKQIKHLYAILQWVGEQPGSPVVGVSSEDRIKLWEYAAPLTEMTCELAAGCTEPGDVDIARKRVQERVRPFLSTVSKMLGDRPLFLSQPTMGDVDLFELLEYSNALDPTILTTIEPNLIAFHKRFLALPAIAACLRNFSLLYSEIILIRIREKSCRAFMKIKSILRYLSLSVIRARWSSKILRVHFVN